LRLNLSKGGLSTSLGPRGADINIGRHGMTTNAGIPGTGLSYRQKVGKPGSWLGIAMFVAALGFAAAKYTGVIGALFGGAHNNNGSVVSSILPHSGSTAANNVESAATAATGIRYVHRGNSNLREAPSNSARTLKKEPKGAKVTLLAVSDKWSKVQDGGTVGWMRTSVLGEAPPE